MSKRNQIAVLRTRVVRYRRRLRRLIFFPSVWRFFNYGCRLCVLFDVYLAIYGLEISFYFI